MTGSSTERTVSQLESEYGVPLIALVGRPNVGKSRLFNRMTGTRFAIVEDLPGVTRDRQYGEGHWDGRRFQVVDTGGFEPSASDAMLTSMREQAQLAIDEAQIIVHLLDGQVGLLPADREIAGILRQTDKPVFTVVNKIDGPKHDQNVLDFYQIGVAELHPLSAEHGLGYADLLDAIEPHLPKAPRVQRDESLLRLAVVGRPNAGKSTLVNGLLGEDRLLTSAAPGTTRDAINTYLEREGQRYLFIDTAGVRRKRSIYETVEKMSVVQAFKAMDRADVVLHVIDATEPLSTQDQRIAGMAQDKGCGTVIVLNKWDIVEKDHRTADAKIRDIRERMPFVSHAPFITISALTGLRVHKLYSAIHAVREEHLRRVPTGQLNRFVGDAVRRNPPPSKSGRRLKILYMSQVSAGPPTFMVVVNNPALVHFSYQRYLANALREAFGFEGVPVKLFFRERGQRKRDED